MRPSSNAVGFPDSLPVPLGPAFRDLLSVNLTLQFLPQTIPRVPVRANSQTPQRPIARPAFKETCHHLFKIRRHHAVYDGKVGASKLRGTSGDEILEFAQDALFWLKADSLGMGSFKQVFRRDSLAWGEQVIRLHRRTLWSTSR